jgi:hypothetical protein
MTVCGSESYLKHLRNVEFDIRNFPDYLCCIIVATEAQMRVRLLAIAAATMASVLSAPAVAQWINYPTPGIPRLPDGKPNLSAPAPKTPDGKPDLSGVWVSPGTKYFFDLTADGVEAPMLPRAAALYKERLAQLQKGHPSERCIGHGVTDYDTVPAPRRFIQTAGMIAILFESYNHYRQIFLDGRPLPKLTQPPYMGYSVGHWEGDTLVVDTTGLNEKGWLDMNGHPQTETTHITERYRRSDFGHLDLQLIIEDPNAYSKPWGISMVLNYFADEDMIENMCENEKDYPHLVGK